MADKKIYSVSCPNLTVNHKWTDQKLKFDRKTKSLSNMAFLYHELEIDTKNMGVSNTFEIEEHDKKFSASCPNLMQNHELTIKKLNCDNKSKSLPNMVLTYSDELEIKKAYNSEKITGIECSKEEIEIPEKKRRTIYKRVKRFFKGLSTFYEICQNYENFQVKKFNTKFFTNFPSNSYIKNSNKKSVMTSIKMFWLSQNTLKFNTNSNIDKKIVKIEEKQCFQYKKEINIIVKPIHSSLHSE
ncbi:hypothetical protein AGLY_001558 [Aphis glycines]|uniref:Uncharacterized protein n=1 Tax=Aphis glycines TaxID=307491 RepID=A0A6G0U6Y9_APHGL|nr:hypothetical protein AGLY_001558 [Aphis glycines]